MFALGALLRLGIFVAPIAWMGIVTYPEFVKEKVHVPYKPTLDIVLKPAEIEPVKIDSAEHECLAKNLYFEARSEGESAMLAVGYVTLNRVEDPQFPNSVCEVVMQGPRNGGKITRHNCQFSWFCDGKSDKTPINNSEPEVQAWEQALQISHDILSKKDLDITQGSLYYHANYVKPFWIAHMQPTTTIGTHLFYK